MFIGGKIIGALFGYMLLGPFGALLGLYIGSKFDRARSGIYSGGFGSFGNFGSFGGFNNEDRAVLQQKFFHATFATMGHMAKAKGHVTEQEIRVASAIMQRMGLDANAKADAQQAFREGKEANFPLDEVLHSMRQNLKGRSDLIRFFLEVQIQAAFADGEVQAEEREVLYRIGDALGFTRAQIDQRLQMQEAAYRFQQGGFGGQHGGGSQGSYQQTPTKDQLSAAYEVLGVDESVSKQELKRAHRKLMNEHHPDKLVSKGLPPEMIEMAKQKTQEIQAAYDLIRKERGFK